MLEYRSRPQKALFCHFLTGFRVPANHILFVQCDEQKPICLNCTRHELQCEFLNPKPGLSPPFGDSPAATRSPSTSVAGYPARSPEAHNLRVQLPPTPDEFYSQALNMAHLELLYNYCMSTCHTLSWNPVLKTLYQTSVLKIGLECDYVMHSILSMSALHLARLKPDQERYYLTQALDLHRASLTGGSAAVSNVTPGNCVHLYVFSIFTFMFALARPRESNAFLLEGETGLGQWLFMFRGTRIVVESSDQSLLREGILGPMFKIGRQRVELQASSSSQVDHLWMLQRLVNETKCSNEELRTYNTAIDDLRRSFNVLYNQNPHTCEAADVFLWLYKLSDAYLHLLHQRRPEALAIFAYFCVLLKLLDTSWWVQGCSTHLISQIHGALDEEHRLWITWPIREIGWIP